MLSFRCDARQDSHPVQAAQQQGPEPNPNAGQQPPKDDVVDADYTVVD